MIPKFMLPGQAESAPGPVVNSDEWGCWSVCLSFVLLFSKFMEKLIINFL